MPVAFVLAHLRWGEPRTILENEFVSLGDSSAHVASPHHVSAPWSSYGLVVAVPTENGGRGVEEVLSGGGELPVGVHGILVRRHADALFDGSSGFVIHQDRNDVFVRPDIFVPKSRRSAGMPAISRLDDRRGGLASVALGHLVWPNSGIWLHEMTRP